MHEKGAEAAAATVIEIMAKSMTHKRSYEIKRPFKFFIHSLKRSESMKKGAKQSGFLYFSGVVNCPMNNCGK